MTRAEFLNSLYRRLGSLDKEQAEQHLTYYAEMLMDRMEEGMSEEEAVGSMEAVDTIARRILEEEGKTYRPVEEIAAPPSYPDASKLGGGGGKRAYQAPRKWSGRKLAQTALWALAIFIALGAVGRWLYSRGSNTRVDYATETPIPVEEAAPYAEWNEDYAMEMPYEYGYEYGSGPASYFGGSLKKLDIEWAAGMVYIQSWDGDEIQLQEYARSELTERSAMQVEDKEDTLSVRYRSGASLGSVKGDKWLAVLVPDGMLEELDIETTSANVQLIGLEQGELDVSTASGYIALSDCYLQKTDLETISGGISFNGVHGTELDVSTTSGYVSGEAHCGDVEVETTSGDVSLSTFENTETIKISTVSGDLWCNVDSTAIRSIGADSTSGDVSLGLPFDLGFSLEYSTVSGSFTNNSFDLVMQDGKSLCNGGGCEIEVDTVSGDLELY